MKMANILDYHIHHKWVERLLSARLDAPPSTHNLPTLDQCQQADRKLWQLLGEATRSSSGQAADRLIASSNKPGSRQKCFTCFSRCPARQAALHRLSWLHRQSCTGLARMTDRPRVGKGQARAQRATRAAVGSLRASPAAEPARMQARAFVLGTDSKRVARPSLVGAASEGCIYARGHGVGNRTRPWIVRSGRRLSAKNKSDGR